MKNKNIELIIQRYLSNEITPEEIDILSNWVKVPENKIIFEKSIQLDTDILISGNDIDPQIAFQKNNIFEKEIRGIGYYMKYAAILVGLLLTAAYAFNSSFFKFKSSNEYSGIPKIEVNVKPVTIQYANGEVKKIDLDATGNLTNDNGIPLAVQEKGKISYLDANLADENLSYNTITVPYGNNFMVQLSDGSTAHLNAGTTLRYPTSFNGQQDRRVYLEGEGFFNVISNAEKPFIVISNKLNVKALGTSFNVTAYSDDDVEKVVLVEGAVRLNASDNNYQVDLSPGFKGTYDKSTETTGISVQAVNTSLYTDWTEGRLTFRNMPFKDIIDRLEKRYSITIVNKNKALNDEIYNASFDRESVEKILSYFQEIYNIEITVVDNIVYIN